MGGLPSCSIFIAQPAHLFANSHSTAGLWPSYAVLSPTSETGPELQSTGGLTKKAKAQLLVLAQKKPHFAFEEGEAFLCGLDKVHKRQPEFYT